MIQEAIKKIVDKQDLSYEEAYAVMNEIMGGETTPTQNAAFLAALSTKSSKAETIPEISGCAEAMRSHATKFHHSMPVLDIVGTGGDGAHTFNISTTSAFIIAAAGVAVAKHGNRAASSNSGTADCLEALGVNITLEPERMEEVLNKTGMSFLFAQKYHSSMKYVGAIRKELGIRTVFNILGPLTNPSSPEMMLLGVYDEVLVELVARVMSQIGVKDGMVVYGLDKMDEISISGQTKICEFHGDEFDTYIISPEDFGMQLAAKSDVAGGTPAENAATTIAILDGSLKGAKRDVVLLNAGAALYVAKKAASMADGIKLAAELIDNGAALKKLYEFRDATKA